jgi:hypothetical protein
LTPNSTGTANWTTDTFDAFMTRRINGFTANDGITVFPPLDRVTKFTTDICVNKSNITVSWPSSVNNQGGTLQPFLITPSSAPNIQLSVVTDTGSSQDYSVYPDPASGGTPLTGTWNSKTWRIYKLPTDSVSSGGLSVTFKVKTCTST